MSRATIKLANTGTCIENLVVVERRKIKGSARDMLGFETITLVPIDTRLIEPKLLSDDERR
jgi:Xaa-Pro aminopeptidase